MKHFTIPPFLSHLPVDERGYPIAFFVPVVDGVADFKTLDPDKQLLCVVKKLCGICGKPLDHLSYILSGPVGLSNRACSDPPMHRQCAEFSLNACPHLYFQQSNRKIISEADGLHIYDKPDHMLIVEITGFKLVETKNGSVIRFTPRRARKYGYTDGRLGPLGNWAFC